MNKGFNSRTDKKRRKPQAPGRVKIIQALTALLREKDFSAITTAEIARNAGVTEALIYRHFRDKKDLFYQVLIEYMDYYKVKTDDDLKGITGALNKLRKIIWSHINVYANDRAFARILLLEVRGFSDYYTSGPYKMVRDYSDKVLKIISEGMENGEIRNDLPPSFLRQVILGSIEHVCMTGVALNRDFSPDDLTEKLCRFIFRGIEKKSEGESVEEIGRI